MVGYFWFVVPHSSCWVFGSFSTLARDIFPAVRAKHIFLFLNTWASGSVWTLRDEGRELPPLDNSCVRRSREKTLFASCTLVLTCWQSVRSHRPLPTLIVLDAFHVRSQPSTYVVIKAGEFRPPRATLRLNSFLQRNLFYSLYEALVFAPKRYSE